MPEMAPQADKHQPSSSDDFSKEATGIEAGHAQTVEPRQWRRRPPSPERPLHGRIPPWGLGGLQSPEGSPTAGWANSIIVGWICVTGWPYVYTVEASGRIDDQDPQMYCRPVTKSGPVRRLASTGTERGTSNSEGPPGNHWGLDQKTALPASTWTVANWGLGAAWDVEFGPFARRFTRLDGRKSVTSVNVDPFDGFRGQIQTV
eukprot:gene5219-biopygen19197